MTAPADREFAVFARGERREDLLAAFRTGLRQYVNPETGQTFGETEIATATAPGSRYWNEADAIDLVLLAEQQRALWLADQVRVDRAGSSWLIGYHGNLWGERLLPATGASGPTIAEATPGTVFVGSTVLPDPAAHYATDPKGLKFQVKQTKQTPNTGKAALTLVAVDKGTATNLEPGTELTWANGPLTAQPKLVTTGSFTGGTNHETNAEFAKRLIARIRHKQAAGNESHFRSWGRDASNAVEDALVYACAFHAGSTLVAIVQKRAGAIGPLARIPTLTTLEAVRDRLVPKLSPDVPARAHVVVVAVVPVASDGVLKIAMPRGSAAGWTDLVPFPGHTASVAAVTLVVDPSNFVMHADDPKLPAGITKPSLMLWNPDATRFEPLLVSKVTKIGPTDYQVLLSAPPSKVIAAGDWISPDTSRRDSIAETIERYFDDRGPGEVIDLDDDERAHRAFRFPEPHEELPFRAGSSITAYLADALSAVPADAELVSMSVKTPPLPVNPILGPRMLVPGKVAIYAA